MASMPWVKLYTELLDDPKMGRLTDVLKWRFIQLVLVAGECDQEGLIPLYSDDIAWRLRIDKGKLVNDLEKLEDLGFLAINKTPSDYIDSITVTNFSKRQGRSQASKRDKWRERQQRHRDKEKDVTGDKDVTHEEVTSLDKTRGEESKIREEKDKTLDIVNLFEIYEANIGPLTPMIAEQIKDWEEHYVNDWVSEAIEIAVKNEIRKASYISGILKNWHTEGKGKKGVVPKSIANRPAVEWK